MARPMSKAKELWECPKCGWWYQSPITIKGISHPCQTKQKLGNVRLRRTRVY